MLSPLEKLHSYPTVKVQAGEVLIEEAKSSDRMYVLVDGTLEVYRGNVSIAIVDDPGALFGEMSVLLQTPHTANVRAVTNASVHVIERAGAFLLDNPDFALPIARLLAERLQHATTYLVDMKRQFADRSDHFQMVDEVLEALLNTQPQEFTALDDGQRGRSLPESPSN